LKIDDPEDKAKLIESSSLAQPTLPWRGDACTKLNKNCNPCAREKVLLYSSLPVQTEKSTTGMVESLTKTGKPDK
jgi:hypothetical protein